MRPHRIESKSLETKLTNVLIADLMDRPGRPGRTAKGTPAEPFPVIEVLREAPVANDDAEALPPAPVPEDFTTIKFIRVVMDADDTVPHVLYSKPYEKIEIEQPATRKRANTIPRAMLATAAQTLVRNIDGDETVRFRRQSESSPYELIEIKHLEPAARPSLTAMTSGRFEASWFASPDDVIEVEQESPPAPSTSSRWLLVSSLLLGAFTLGLTIAFVVV
jgi:hypothetical protein